MINTVPPLVVYRSALELFITCTLPHMEKSDVIGKEKPLYSQPKLSYITGLINLLCKLVVKLHISKSEIPFRCQMGYIKRMIIFRSKISIGIKYINYIIYINTIIKYLQLGNR